MVKPIVHDPVLLARASRPATPEGAWGRRRKSFSTKSIIATEF